jgi:hypothetical protein
MRCRSAVVPLVLVLSAIGLAACEDDSESSDTTTTTTPGQVYCADADQLRDDLSSLADLEVPDDGTDALTAQIDALESDVSTLKSSASEVASTEIAAFEASVDDLQSALSSISGDLTLSNAASVVRAIESVGTSGSDVVSTLDEACS